MKVRDLGKAILDFELENIPKAIKATITLSIAILTWGVAICFGLLCSFIRLYKRFSGLIFISCIFIFFSGMEKDCTRYCWGLIDLYNGYAISEDYLFTVIALIIGIVVSFKLDKELSSTTSE